MENTTKEILKHLKNTHTKVEIKEGFMGNYYSPLIDTIYIAQNFENKQLPPNATDINKNAAELVTVCHECIHSVQSKYMHLVNTIFSNISIILAVIYVIIGLFWTNPLWFKVVASVLITASIVVRLALEVGAVNGSIKLAETVVDQGMMPNVSREDIEAGVKYINKYKITALLQMVIDKIIFLILVLIIK